MRAIWFFILGLIPLSIQAFDIQAPISGQMIRTDRPRFMWTARSSATKYDLQLTLQADNLSAPCLNVSRSYSNIVPQVSGSQLYYDLPAGVTLQDATTYKLCLTAKSDTQTFETLVAIFRTKIVLKTPSITINPPTTSQAPNGSETLMILGENGEEGATARIYLKGAQDIEVGSSLVNSSSCRLNLTSPSSWTIDPICRFQVSLSATQISSEAGERKYYAVIERSATERSSASSTGSYFYDSRYSLRKPVLRKGQLQGQLVWDSVPDATVYRVFRRKSLEACNSGDCFFNKPFEKIAETSNPQYDDSSMRSFSDSRGLSYFVTAHKMSGATELATSNRSNAVSFMDTRPPILSEQVGLQESVEILASQTGRAVSIYYCNVDGGGFLNADNSPDLAANVLYFPRAQGGNCQASRATYEGNFLAYTGRSTLPSPITFDALQAMTDRSRNLNNCVYAGDVRDLAPATPFCFSICLKDESSNQQVNCTNQEKETLPDRVAPDFEGIKDARPLIDGRSVEIDWDLAREDRTTNEVIQYQIQSTSDFINDAPQFKALNEDQDILTLASGVHSSTIHNLKTGTKYCFKVSALDDFRNVNTAGNRYLCATTYDNRSAIQDLTVSSLSLDEAYKLVLRFKILDREADLPGHKVGLDSLSYRLNGGDWQIVKREHLEGSLDNLKASTSINGAPWNEIVFNTLPYFAGEQNIELKLSLKDSLTGEDLAGNSVSETLSETSAKSSGALVVFQGMSKIASYGDNGLSGCNLSSKGNLPKSWILFIFGTILALLLLRRRLAA